MLQRSGDQDCRQVQLTAPLPANHRMSTNESSNRASVYWRANIRFVLALLLVWLAVSFGAGIVFVDQLNQFRIGGIKLGFWFAQQGSIYVFLLLIVIYVIGMNRLDRKHGVAEQAER